MHNCENTFNMLIFVFQINNFIIIFFLKLIKFWELIGNRLLIIVQLLGSTLAEIMVRTQRSYNTDFNYVSMIFITHAARVNRSAVKKQGEKKQRVHCARTNSRCYDSALLDFISININFKKCRTWKINCKIGSV